MSKTKINPEKIPKQLKSVENWIGWKSEKRDGDLTKVPYDPSTDERASSTDPETWTNFETLKNKPKYGLGFVFTDSPFAGIDLDHCRDPETGELEEWAKKIVDKLDSYTEVSPSGTGLHILIKGKLPNGRNRKNNLEMYDSGRYFTVTGNHLKETPEEIKDREQELRELHEKVFREEDKNEDVNLDGEGTRLSEDQVLKLARNAKNGDKFEKLWSGDTSGYPSHSEADQALCSLLAFYTGPDAGQIDSLFRESGLCRDKWTERKDYRQRTIETALSGHNEFYRPPRSKAPAEEESSSGKNISPEKLDQWNKVDQAYKNGDKQDARILASEILQNERKFKVLPEGDQFLVYKPDQGIYTDFGEEFIEAKLQTKISQDLSNHEIREIKGHIKRSNYGREKDFGPDNKDLLCVKNGVFDLETEELLEHSKDYQFRRQLPVKYDPKASSEVLNNFLKETLREDDIELIEEIAGHCLYRDYIPQRAIMFHGEGSNGKGVTLDLIENMLGSENVANQSLQRFTGQNRRFGSQFLYKKFANIAGDLPGDKLQGTNVFKQLTGQDSIDAEVKGANRTIKFKNYATMIFSANKIPQSPDDTDAFHRRWILITFPYKFVNDPEGSNEKQRDSNQRDKLNTEEVKSAMFNRAVEGLQRLQRFGRFNYDPTTSEARKLWQLRARPIKAFAENNLETGEDKWETKEDIYTAYKRYCEKNDIPDHEIKQQGGFSRELKKYVDWENYKPKKEVTGTDTRKACYKGFELIDIPF